MRESAATYADRLATERAELRQAVKAANRDKVRVAYCAHMASELGLEGYTLAAERG